VLANPAFLWRRYVIAWIVSALVLGGLLSAMDRITGRVDVTRMLTNAGIAAIVSAVALGAGAWWISARGTRSRGAARFLMLALIHGVVILLVAYPFI
jgi:hypothetical protein